MQVAHSFIEELQTITADNDYCFIISSAVQSVIEPETYPDTFSFHLLNYNTSLFLKDKSFEHEVTEIEQAFRPDVVFTLFGPPYWRPSVPHLCGYAIPHFIYENSPFYHKISFIDKVKWKLLGKLKFISLQRDCDYYVTETQDVANRLSKKLSITGSKIFTVGNTCNAIFDEQERWESVSEKIETAKGFKLLTISKFYTHKNLSVIPDVIDYLCSEYPGFDFTFIVTVDEDNFKPLKKNQRKHLLCLGNVKIEECPMLYQKSDALFLPTLLECFTVSYLEAMKMNKPILTSDLPFAHDICDDAAVYFDPMDPEQIGEEIMGLAKDEYMQKNIVSRGQKRLKNFGTAADRAQKYLDILEFIVEQTDTETLQFNTAK